MKDVSVFEYDQPAQFLKAWISSLPKQGRGMGTRMAELLGVSPTMISQLLSGEKSLSAEAGVQLGEFMGLSDIEIDFLLLLIEKERAGHHRLKARVQDKIRKAKKEATNLEKRVEVNQELDDKAKAIYYSSWLYTAVRNLSALPDVQDLESLSKHLQVPIANLNRVLQFLLEQGLCEMSPKGLTYKSKWTHLPARSPLVVKHHQNWRLRGLHVMDDFRDEDFFFTGPMSMSKEVAEKIRLLLPEIVERIQKDVGPSESEITKCLNIDWFGY